MENHRNQWFQNHLGDYCVKVLNISPKYLSDLLKKETGKSAKGPIDDFLMNRTKDRNEPNEYRSLN